VRIDDWKAAPGRDSVHYSIHAFPEFRAGGRLLRFLWLVIGSNAADPDVAVADGVVMVLQL